MAQMETPLFARYPYFANVVQVPHQQLSNQATHQNARKSKFDEKLGIAELATQLGFFHNDPSKILKGEPYIP